eukprot:1159784-Pelagomonas_calceolata.AAC.14
MVFLSTSDTGRQLSTLNRMSLELQEQERLEDPSGHPLSAFQPASFQVATYMDSYMSGIQARSREAAVPHTRRGPIGLPWCYACALVSETGCWLVCWSPQRGVDLLCAMCALVSISGTLGLSCLTCLVCQHDFAVIQTSNG